MKLSVSDSYIEDQGSFFLRDLPVERRPAVRKVMEETDSPFIRLKLSSGHVFSLPLASRESPGRHLQHRAGLRARTLQIGKKLYFRLGPAIARFGLLPVARLMAARLAAGRRASGTDGVIEDDAIFEFVGQTLITHDDSFGKPSTLGLSLTNRCNLACTMCPYHGPDERKKHIDGYFDERQAIAVPEFERIVSYCAENGITLQLGQQDEPLLLLLRDEYRSVLVRYKPLTSITTNGTLLRTERDWEKIASLPGLHHVGISIDAADPDTYQKIRGDDLAELHRNVLGFFEYLRKRRPEVKRRVCFVVQPGNTGEEDRFLQFWRPHVHQVSFYQMTTYEEGSVNFGANYHAGRRTPCDAIFSTMYVMPNGDVLPCCLFMYNAPYEGRNAIATFSEKSWTSNEYHELRSSITSERFGKVCDKCTIWRQGLDRETVENGMRVTSNPYEKHYYIN